MPILLPQLILSRIRVCTRLLNVVLFLGLAIPLYAEVITDGTVGPAQTLISQPVAGGFSDFIINENLGTRAGANLFHSFERFNIASNEGAIFLGSPDIDNVISRVTGGQSSNINGLLFSNIGNQGFYFINPAGVMFGANAQIDVPASFYVSTANELRFNDGSIFSASNPNASTFSIDQPESFGFLGDQSSTINFAQSNIGLKPDSTLSISGNGVDISSTRLSIDQGDIQLIATGDTVTDVTVYGELSTPAQGDLTIGNSLINVTGDGAGRIVIHAGESEIILSSVVANNNDTTDARSDQGIDIHADSLKISTSIISTDTNTQGQKAADISITVGDNFSVVNGGEIRSSTFAKGDAGSIKINAGKLEIDGQGSVIFTGIASDANSGSSGDAGNVTVMVAKKLSVINEGLISSSTFGAGHAGKVEVNSGQLEIDGHGSEFFTGILSATISGDSGNAGVVAVTVADQLSVVNSGKINSSTFGAGKAGDVNVDAGQLSINGLGSEFITGIISDGNSGNGDAGNVAVTVADQLSLVNGGQIRSSIFSEGDGGEVTITAGQLAIDRQGSGINTGISSDANRGSSGKAGTVAVIVKDRLSVVNGGRISSSTFATGHAGKVEVDANQLEIDSHGSELFTGISSAAQTGSFGNAGVVTVSVTDQLSLIDAGVISSSTSGAGDAGDVLVNAGQLAVNGQGSKFFSGISSDAAPGSGGNGGTVIVEVADQLSVFNGGQISSSTGSEGDAGNVKVNAGQLVIDSQGSKFFSGISSDAAPGSRGGAGTVVVTVVDQLSVVNGGTISSSTGAVGDAGNVKVKADYLLIDGQGNSFLSGIVSDAGPSSRGDAGTVDVTVEHNLSVINGGIISSSTGNVGDAGDVVVDARRVLIDGLSEKLFVTGIASTAENGSLGQAGNITVNTQDLSIVNDGLITIQSRPTVDADTLAKIQPTEINISAQNISLTDSSISTENFGNAPAGSIMINVDNILSLDPSFITTAANNADGGSITINARIIDLLDSQITTSVSKQGNGGNISLNASTIILDSGFIQANTAGTDALGGDIKINTQGLITSRNLLSNGGDIRLTFRLDLNVIQAAAPEGVSGIINIISPELDISGDLSKIKAQLLDLDKLTKDPCETLGGRQSRLANLGRGNLPETPETISSMALPIEYISHFIGPNQVDLVIQDKTSNNSFPPVISRITGLARLKTGSTIPSNRDCREKWMTL